MPAPYAKTEQAVTTLTPQMMERLDAYAISHQLSRAEAMRRFIERGIVAAEVGLERTDTPVARSGGVVGS